MNKALLALALVATLPLAAHAADEGDWSGTGELGFALTSGNTKSENLNAKLQFKKEDDQWKDNFYLTALRNKGEVKIAPSGDTPGSSSYDLTANRYEAGASAGYKLDERSYIVGALRYEKDNFAQNRYQAVGSIGYGYTALKNEQTELSFEIGPGYKRYQPIDTYIAVGEPPERVRVHSSTENEVVGRGLMAFKHKLTDTTALENILLMEAGSKNTFVQNDAGLSVAINKAFALKLGYQWRYNSDTSPGIKNSDQLLTTNLVYNF